MVSSEVDMGNLSKNLNMAIDCPFSLVEDFSTLATRVAKRGMAVVGTPRCHWSGLRSSDEQNIEGGESKDLKERSLASYSSPI